MNAVLWAFHLVVLWVCLPVLRSWWYGGRRHYVLISFLLPPVAALYLIPCLLAYRRREAELSDAAALQVRQRQRAADVAYWRSRALEGDPLDRENALDLLAMWGESTALLETELGAHPYDEDCGCRHCVRARRRASSGNSRR